MEPIQEFNPGIYENMPMSVYRNIPALNKSSMTSLQRSDFHFHYNNKKSNNKISRALAIGSALDMRLFEPENYKLNIKPHPLKTPRKYITEDREILYLHPEDINMIEKMYESLMAHPLTSNIFASGQPQVSLFWIDESTGIRCKARIDFLCIDINLIVDLKTTKDASYNQFRWDAKKYKYNYQASWYQEGYKSLTGKLLNWNYVCIENTPPFAQEQIAIYNLPQIEMDAAALEIDEIKLKYKHYTQNIIHAGYPIEVQDLYLP